MTSKLDNPFRFCKETVAGIDYSIRCPAIVVLPPTTDPSFIIPFNQCTAYYITNNKKYTIDEENIHGTLMGAWEGAEDRYETIAEWAIDILNKHNIKSVGLEDYAFSRQQSSLTILAENAGLLKYFLFKNGISYNLFSPSQIKKSAANKGNADKSLMKDAFYQDNPDYDIMSFFGKRETDTVISPISDIIDAYYIALSERVATGLQVRQYEENR